MSKIRRMIIVLKASIAMVLMESAARDSRRLVEADKKRLARMEANHE